MIGTFANGTAFGFDLAADPSAKVTIATKGDSTFGDFGNGITWESNGQGKSVVRLDVPFYGLSGTLTLNSVSQILVP